MVSLVSFTPVGAGAFRLVWSSDLPSPMFRVFRDGLLLLTTPLTAVTIAIPVGSSPLLEVLDDPAATPTPAFPASIRLTWLQVSGASTYVIDQLVGAAWITRATIADDGSAVTDWQSPAQPDGLSQTFRVTPKASTGAAGTPLSFAKLVVRYPDPPAPAFAYNAATRVVTLS